MSTFSYKRQRLDGFSSSYYESLDQEVSTYSDVQFNSITADLAYMPRLVFDDSKSNRIQVTSGATLEVQDTLGNVLSTFDASVGDLKMSHVVPLTTRALLVETDSTYDIGSNLVRYANAYLDAAYATALYSTNIYITGNSTMRDIVFETDSTYNIGTNAVRPLMIYTDELTTGDVNFTTHNVHSVGSSGVRAANVYSTNVYTNNLIGGTSATAISLVDSFAKALNVKDLTGNEYLTVYTHPSTAAARSINAVEKFNAQGGLAVTGDTKTNAIVPATTNTYDVGTSSVVYKDSYSTRFLAGNGTVSLPAFSFPSDLDSGMYLDSAGELRFAAGGGAFLGLSVGYGTVLFSDLMPSAAGARNIGSTSFPLLSSHITTVFAKDGSVTAPAFAYNDDVNSGFNRIGTDNHGATCGGVQRQTWGSLTNQNNITVPDNVAKAFEVLDDSPARYITCVSTTGSKTVEIGQHVTVPSDGTLDIGTTATRLRAVYADTLYATHRYISSIYQLFANISANTTYTFTRTSNYPSSHWACMDGELTKIQIVVGDASEYAGWTAGTITFGVYINNVSQWTGTAWTKAAYDSAKVGTFGYMVTETMSVPFAVNDEITFYATTSAAWDGTNLDGHIDGCVYYNN